MDSIFASPPSILVSSCCCSNDINSIRWNQYIALLLCADSNHVSLWNVLRSNGICTLIPLQSRCYCCSSSLCHLRGTCRSFEHSIDYLSPFRFDKFVIIWVFSLLKLSTVHRPMLRLLKFISNIIEIPC